MPHLTSFLLFLIVVLLGGFFWPLPSSASPSAPKKRPGIPRHPSPSTLPSPPSSPSPTTPPTTTTPPKHSLTPWLTQIRLYEKKRRFVLALRLLRQAQQHFPQHPSLSAHLPRLLLRLKRIPQALHAYQQHLKKFPHDHQARQEYTTLKLLHQQDRWRANRLQRLGRLLQLFLGALLLLFLPGLWLLFLFRRRQKKQPPIER